MSEHTPITLTLNRLQVTQLLEALTIASKAPHVSMEGTMALALLYTQVKAQADAPAPAPVQPELSLDK